MKLMLWLAILENKIDSTYSNMLLFEVEHNGTYANPENIYGMNIKELS